MSSGAEVLFAIAQIFGAFGPLFYGALIGDGIKAEGKSLEDITKPLTSTQEGTPDGAPLPVPAG